MPELNPLAVTIGEPAGIGPDVILLSWLDAKRSSSPSMMEPFYVIGSRRLLESRARMMGLEVPIVEASPDMAAALFSRALPVVPLTSSLSGKPGKPAPADSKGIIESIERAVDDVNIGKARAVVTAPINKKSLYDAGFSYPGHTEYLAELANQLPTGSTGNIRPVMMLAGPRLRAVPVTIHIPLNQVAASLKTADIVEIAMITARELTSRFGVANPRLAVSGLNPHAGEEGAMGGEDAAIIAPAIVELQQAGIDAKGPFPADTMFHERARKTYDVAICMYHDQALIPAKALDFDETVNVTLGLPFVRTSPDHGTAFDIAATGRADPSSMIAALKLADKMTRIDD